MQRFKNHELDLLVATTVIEVGVDVPNSNLIIIEKSRALRLSPAPPAAWPRRSRQPAIALRFALSSTARRYQQATIKRLCEKALTVFYIAEQDLLIRGPGELLGTRQTGLQQLSVADLERDGHLLPQVKAMAEQLVTQHPQHVDTIIKRWMGDTEQFAQA